MFVRVNSTPNSPRKSIQIVESKRDGHKVKTKIVRHVGIAMSENEAEKLKSLAYEIMAEITLQAEKDKGQSSLLSNVTIQESAEHIKKRFAANKIGRRLKKDIKDILPVEKVTLDQIVEEKRIIEGVTDIALPMYKKLGFDDLLRSEKAKKMLCNLVLARLVEPKSKLKLQEILENQFDKNYDLDAIYRLMDLIHPSIPTIKTLVFNRTKALFPQGINLMLFDVTTLYFESEKVDELRQYGYSKDHRFNTTQLVFALAANDEGLPLGYELFPGNTAEVKTLCAAITEWRKLMDIKDVCFVGDRGMLCDGNISFLEKQGYSYVVATKLRNLNNDMKKNIFDEKNYHAESFDNEIGWVGEFDHNGRRLIVSYKTGRAARDAQKRQTILDKITKILDKSETTRSLIRNHGIKQYTKTVDKSRTVLDKEKIQADTEWDGLHGVLTNLKKDQHSALVVLGRYANLWQIEACFRVKKTNLKIRPIYHWKNERIEAHIAICYMSFAILKNLLYAVNLTQKISPDEIMQELLGVQSSIYVHKQTQDRYRVPGKMSHKAAKIYRAFGFVRNQDATPYF